MKKAKGIVWKYKDSKGNGTSWASEITTIKGGQSICCYGKKKAIGATGGAIDMMLRLGWKLVKPFEEVEKK